jgi:hypothetical protein
MQNHPVYQKTRSKVIDMAVVNLVDDGYRANATIIFSDPGLRVRFLEMLEDPENQDTGDSVSDQVIRDLIQELRHWD